MTGVSSGLIQFRCTASSHQHATPGHTTDTLTVHEGKWSYCPMDVRAPGHEWVATGGVAIEMLRRGSPTISLDLNVRPHVGPPPSSTTRTAAAPRPSQKKATSPATSDSPPTKKRTAR